MDFLSGKNLLEVCNKTNKSISTVMLEREIDHNELTKEEIIEKIDTVLSIMDSSAKSPIEEPRESIGGLIGGEAKKIDDFRREGKNVCGSTLSRAMAYSMGVLEVNATMGLIVAAPTAGSSGIVPGVILALEETQDLDKETMRRSILNASAIGYIMMRNASVSGAEAGCQAEVGSASAMAASAACEIMGGTPQMCLTAAAICLSNLLGLVCDPIAGLVESPCQARNAIGVANALTSAELALAGVTHPIPFDEMVDSMYSVGKSLPFELRETAMGGCAGTPTGCDLGCKIYGSCSKH